MIEARYDWRGVHFGTLLLMLLPVALPPFTPVAVTHETTHTDLMQMYTAGFV